MTSRQPTAEEGRVQYLKIFEISVARPDEPDSSGHIWLMLAKGEKDARNLVPPDHRIVEVTYRDDAVRAVGESRIIGWYGQPAFRGSERPVAGPHPTD